MIKASTAALLTIFTSRTPISKLIAQLDFHMSYAPVFLDKNRGNLRDYEYF
jgi:hypothetical protein